MSYLHSPQEPIAIVGSSCRLAGDATSPSKLWDLLLNPRDVSKKVPSTRFNADGFYHPNGEHHGASNVTHSYFLEEDARLFDCAFFNITPKEAEAIDPQQRLLLETVYEGLESAGYSIKQLQGSNTAVYVGQMTADYTDTQARDPEFFSQYMATGTSRSLTSNRLSYFFDWHGPSMTVDTACSSSLTAVHLAIQNLRSGNSHIACAAGSNLLLGPDLFIGATSLHMISPSGHSQMWDIGADGYARGEGTAAVFLKTLSKALADGDRIECLIRETGVNSDGRTQGITLPSPIAQASLINEVYRRAGLDPYSPDDRPQYFEAHGTGTQAGDPREASAISQSFFKVTSDNSGPSKEQKKLFVGSIKTIVGHTEGTAGIAGLLKVSLAMQNRTIPPNLHLKNLNPSVAPSFTNLQIATKPTPWPSLPPGVPLRGSVNSFGFGGTNSHAIVESYEPDIHNFGPWGNQKPLPVLAPPSDDPAPVHIFLSANSEKSLVASIKKYSQYLRQNETINLRDLSWTLQSRRSAFPVKAVFSGKSAKEIAANMDTALESSSEIGFRSKAPPSGGKPRLLGVFTGQGAQWPAMGRELIQKSRLVSETIDRLEGYLNALPDPPTWSLRKEIMASAWESRLGEAQLSQPLCTALQIALVDLLAESGIKFNAVVGHSSGEIAAAYASGYITARHALYIAYYRGVHSRLSSGTNGEKGGMIAVGLTFAESKELCNRAQFKGRICVAASNSPTSTTLSGDEDAVKEVKEVLDADGVFARALQVDTAYHSHHMNQCSDAYVASLNACKIEVMEPNDCHWFSSVYGLRGKQNANELTATYWRDNMVQSVLFSQSIERALDESEPFDAIIEVGPHAALKGPANQTIKEISAGSIPYTGALDRKKNDVVAFGDTLSMLWTRFGPTAVGFEGFANTLYEKDTKATLLKDLPGYSWEHSQTLWRESRVARQFRDRQDPPHELLGTRTWDDTENEPRWRNILLLEEIPWLKDHRFQGQVVVPGAAYCVMALESSKAFTKNRTVQEVELRNISIRRAISIPDDSAGVETIFSLKKIEDRTIKRRGGGELIVADFNLSAASIDGDTRMRTICTGEIRIFINDDPLHAVYDHNTELSELSRMDIDKFYTQMEDIGLSYSGAFRGIVYAERQYNYASANIKKLHSDPRLNIHPTWLDVCFQTLFAAFASPGDTALWTTFLPTSIGRLTFTPAAIGEKGQSETVIHTNTHLTSFTHASRSNMPTIAGDMQVFGGTTGEMQLQVEELVMGSFAVAAAADDREIYLRNVWAQDVMKGTMNMPEFESGEEPAIIAVERVVYYYIKKLKSLISSKQAPPNIKRLFDFFNESLNGSSARSKNQLDYKTWDRDNPEKIGQIMHEYSDLIEMQMIKAVGEELLSLTRGKDAHQTNDAVEELTIRLFSEGMGFKRGNQQIAFTAQQIAHRYPRMNILEIGGGPSSVAEAVVSKLGTAFASYVLTDSSSEVVEQRAGEMEDHRKFSSKVLNVEVDIKEQGFDESSIDLVIVSGSLHNVTDLNSTLQNIRRIMRPGGFLLSRQATGTLLQFHFMMAERHDCSGNESGHLEPGTIVSPVEWDSKLRISGFSGIDTIAYDCDEPPLHTCSVMVSQATNEQIHMLRYPLQTPSSVNFDMGTILIIGGQSLITSGLIHELRTILSRWQQDIVTAPSFEDIDKIDLSSIGTVISLEDLDSSFIHGLNGKKLKNLQIICAQLKSMLWVTSGSRADNPYHAAMLGLGRTIASESPHLKMQFLDLDSTEQVERVVSETFLRLLISELPEVNDGSSLWSTETELAVEKGKLLIPRLLPWTKANDRLNSVRRVITKNVNISESTIEILPPAEDENLQVYSAQENPVQRRIPLAEDQIRIKLRRCTVYPVDINESLRLYICIANIVKDREKVLAFTPWNASFATIPRSWMISISVPTEQEANLLEATARHLTTNSIVEGMSSRDAFILYDLEERLASSVQRLSAEKGKRVRFISSTRRDQESVDWTFVSPHTMKRTIHSFFPSGPTLLMNFTQRQATSACGFEDCLPKSCDVRNFFQMDPMYSTDISKPMNYSLTSAIGAVRSEGLSQAQVISVSSLLAMEAPRPVFEIVNWIDSSTVPALTKPIDASLLLSPSKTYLLVGLTGDLGQSLCRWMVANGARSLVICSRNPQVDSNWKRELQQLGAEILIQPMDVTSKESVMKVRDIVETEMSHTIGGIVNGAMILADGLFADMSFENFVKVLKPKIDGSNNLDTVFSNDLDFFIMFSSLSATIGNPSQANYAAANQYMVALAAQRRKRGLAASVIDIGMILGIGYIQRTDGDVGGIVERSLRKQNYLPLAEPDIHQLFGEAILTGQVDSGQDSEIVTGLERLDLTASERPVWHKIPRFSHHVLESTLGDTQASKKSSKSLQSELTMATTTEQVFEILQRYFSAQLASMLKLAPDDVNAKIPIIDLGIDSLVAVEVRAWFLNEVKEDMPVLKVLGGASIEDLCNDVVPKIPLAAAGATRTESVPTQGKSGSKEVVPPKASMQSSTASSDKSSSLNTPESGTPPSELSEEVEVSVGQPNEYTKVGKMSLGQSRIWFLSLYLNDHTTYNCTTAYRLTGPLDLERFKKAFSLVIKRHESFRTRFYTDPSSGQAMQAVSETSNFKLNIVESSNKSDDFDKEFRNVADYKYELGNGDAFIATLLKHNINSHTIIFGYHHIIMDGVSWQIFLQDLEKSYAKNLPPSPSPTQYFDFSINQQKLINSATLKSQRDYWESELTNLPGPLPLLPFAKTSSRKALNRYETRDLVVDMKASLVSNIKKASQKAKTTTFHFYMSALQVLFYRFVGVEDIVIGITDANRTDENFMNTVGFLLNFLPLRCRLDGQQPFSVALRNTRSKAYAALGNSQVPFDTIIQDLKLETSTTDTPLFQVILNYRMGALKHNSVGDINLDFLAYEDAKNPFDIAMSVDEKEDGTGMLTLSILSYLYDEEGCNIILDTYLHLLEDLAADTSVSIDDVQLFNTSSINDAIALGTGPSIESSWPDTLSRRIDDLVAMQPHEVALKDASGTALTYEAMYERVNSVSDALRRQGVTPGAYVASFCEQSNDVVCSLLAIMRIGAIYIPLDVRSSTERLVSIVKDTKPKVVICHELTKSRGKEFSKYTKSLLNISDVPLKVKTRIPNVSRGSDPALLLFTSGSTGKPKGILLTNHNYVTQTLAASERMDLGKEVVLQQSALGFDASLAQMFYGLANGGKLILASNRGDPADLTRLMAKEKVTFTLCVPSEYSVLLQYGSDALKECNQWRVAMCGGEAFNPRLKAKFRELGLKKLKVFNAYGPSEIAVASSIGEVLYQEKTSNELEKVPIGPPLSNYGVHILDENHKPVPIGWPGEICISGPGVAIGYFQNNELSQAKFVSNTIFKKPVDGWNKVYHTGDRGRMLNHGEVVFLGRMDGDSQVKLRGIRIELGEISTSITVTSQGVLDDAVVGLRGGDDEFLAAYVVFAKGQKPDSPAGYLKQLLRSLPLPSYMRPAIAIPLEFLPMTAAGKLDSSLLKNLPLPDDMGMDKEESLNEQETQVKEVWESVLSETGLATKIGKDSDFFSVGGNSLLLLRLQVELRERFGMDIPVATLFQINTLEGLASHIGGNEADKTTTVLDWEKESDITSEITTHSYTVSASKVKRQGQLSVLLTGSTGFLGRAILDQLVRTKSVSRIHCVAVRANKSGKQRKPLGTSAKIVIHEGDLSFPLLGMAEREAEQVFGEIDMIIHNGADVSFMKTYQSLRSSNVQSTKELARLALPRKIPFHYISTAGVAHLRGDEPLGEISLAAYTPPVDGSDGYVSSKWASERFLEKTNKEYKLPVWIHRPASIVGEDAPSMDIMNNTLRFSRKMRLVPNMSGWTGYFDFVSVETVGRGVVEEALNGNYNIDKSTEPTYIHHSGENVVPISGFQGFLEREEGQRYKEVSLADWVKNATENGMHELVGTFLNALAASGTGLNMPVLLNRRNGANSVGSDSPVMVEHDTAAEDLEASSMKADNKLTTFFSSLY